MLLLEARLSLCKKKNLNFRSDARWIPESNCAWMVWLGHSWIDVTGIVELGRSSSKNSLMRIVCRAANGNSY